jgi:hypothetical protein
MWKIASAVWYGLLGALFPAARWPGVRAIHPGIRWGLHIFLLLLALVGLVLIDLAINFSRLVDSRTKLADLHLWLPIFFLLLYALVWIVWWIWGLLAAPEEGPDFPDIAEAWTEAVQALGAAGIALTDLPLFLVLGRTEGPEDGLFDAAHDVQWQVRAPQRPAPLHVYATLQPNYQGIYVTCAGASLLGKLAANLALEGSDERAGVNEEADFDQDSIAVKTIMPRGKGKKFIRNLGEALKLGVKPPGLLKRALRRQAGSPMRKLLANRGEVEMLSARLDYFCRLVVRDRQPYCPINGILLLLPFGGTDTDDEAQESVGVCQRDLATVRRVLRVNCPLFILVCDMETIPGFRELILGRSLEDRLRRFGQGFPLAPDLTGEATLEETKKAVDAMCTDLYQEWVYSQFHLEQPEGEDLADSVAANSRLFDLLTEMHKRRQQFSRVVAGALAGRDGEGPLLFGGCYNAGTGTEREGGQAFVSGVIRHLPKNQNYVSWTDEALAQDANDHRVASLGYTFLAILCLAVVALGAFFIFGPGKKR